MAVNENLKLEKMTFSLKNRHVSMRKQHGNCALKYE